MKKKKEERGMNKNKDKDRNNGKVKTYHNLLILFLFLLYYYYACKPLIWGTVEYLLHTVPTMPKSPKSLALLSFSLNLIAEAQSPITLFNDSFQRLRVLTADADSILSTKGYYM